MSEFTQLLHAAMNQGANRSQAEKQIEILCLNDTANFFTNLVKELINESNPDGLR